MQSFEEQIKFLIELVGDKEMEFRCDSKYDRFN
jgi:hypothetical protein